MIHQGTPGKSAAENDRRLPGWIRPFETVSGRDPWTTTPWDFRCPAPPSDMATVMEFTTSVDEFPLGTVFGNLSGVTVELERLIPHEDLIIPYFWVRGADVEDISAEFEAHAGVVNVRLIDSVEDEHLMRAEWTETYFGVLSALAETSVVLLSGIGTPERWEFEVRGETRDAISDFRESCRANDIPIEIRAVHTLMPVREGGYDLTDAQRKAMVLAYERGYFDSPRTTTLQDLADELAITQQSLSSRLRRGHRRLIGATLVQA